MPFSELLRHSFDASSTNPFIVTGLCPWWHAALPFGVGSLVAFDVIERSTSLSLNFLPGAQYKTQTFRLESPPKPSPQQQLPIGFFFDSDTLALFPQT